MDAKREQSRCKDCEYIRYPREKKEPCPKCKSSRVSYTSGLGRVLVAVFLLGLAGAVVFAGIYFKDRIWSGYPVAENSEVAEEEKQAPPKEPSEPTPAPEEPDDPPGDKETSNIESLTKQRTWTARNGKTLEAKLLSLSLVEGQYVGVFERPDGGTFNYKIGNLSKTDVDLVKGIVAQSKPE